MDYSNRRTAAVLYTVGQSNHPVDGFIELIGAAGIELIVDVRSVPFSRFAPQFNKAALEKSLASARIGYCYLGDLLGGRPGGRTKGPPLSWEEASASASFREGLRRLWELSVSKRCAVMCAERDPDRCHRKHLIAAAVVMMGGAVTHLLYDGTLAPEKPEPCIVR
jgi:uncharacterized protein (DUF488 family)